MIKRLVDSFLDFVIGRSFNRGKCRLIDCSCGKKYEVWTGRYGGGDTGMGCCECGKCTTYIN